MRETKSELDAAGSDGSFAAMPATRAKFSKCGHRAFGARCPRCADADRLDVRAEREAQAGRARDAEALKAEAKRLRGPQMRGVRRPMPIVEHHEAARPGDMIH